MIGQALRICILTRLCSRSFGITGQERLGIAEVTDVQSPYFGRVPVPPILDAQIDELWRAHMIRSKKALLSKLKASIFARRRDAWLEIFLTIFILLSNIEFCYRQKCGQLRRHVSAVGDYSFRTARFPLILLSGCTCASLHVFDRVNASGLASSC
jgi:hypothetical protein